MADGSASLDSEMRRFRGAISRQGAQGASGSLARSLTAGVVLFAGEACYVMS